MVKMKKETKASIEMLVCASLWSIAGVLMKFIPWNSFSISSSRSLIAGITIAAFMYFNKIPFRFDKHIALSGIISGCVYICFTAANKLTTAANAIVLQFTAPVFIVIYSALFKKERPSLLDVGVVAFTMLGIALFFFDSLTPGNLLGNIVAIISGLFMALMFVMFGDMPLDRRFSGIACAQAFTFLVGLPVTIITKPELSIISVGSILILGIFQLGLSYCLYAKASEICPPLTCSLLSAMEPLLNPVWVMLFYGEKPGFYALIGGIIVIITITGWTVIKSKIAQKNEYAEHVSSLGDSLENGTETD